MPKETRGFKTMADYGGEFPDRPLAMLFDGADPKNPYFIENGDIYRKMVKISGVLDASLYMLKFGTEQTIPPIESIPPEKRIPGRIDKDVEDYILHNMERVLQEGDWILQKRTTPHRHNVRLAYCISGTGGLGKLETGITDPASIDEKLYVYRAGTELFRDYFTKAYKRVHSLSTSTSWKKPAIHLIKQDQFKKDDATGLWKLSKEAAGEIAEDVYSSHVVIVNEDDVYTLLQEKEGIARKLGDNDLQGAIILASLLEDFPAYFKSNGAYFMVTSRNGINTREAELTGRDSPVSIVFDEIASDIGTMDRGAVRGLDYHVVGESRSRGGTGGMLSKVAAGRYLAGSFDTSSVVLGGRNSLRNGDAKYADEYGWPICLSTEQFFSCDHVSGGTVMLRRSVTPLVRKLLKESV